MPNLPYLHQIHLRVHQNMMLSSAFCQDISDAKSNRLCHGTSWVRGSVKLKINHTTTSMTISTRQQLLRANCLVLLLQIWQYIWFQWSWLFDQSRANPITRRGVLLDTCSSMIRWYFTTILILIHFLHKIEHLNSCCQIKYGDIQS